VPEMLRRIHGEAQALSGERRHLFSLEADATLHLSGVEAELYSAFSNLVTNAVQYTPARGVIRIRWYGDEAGAHFAVEDNGIGIPAEHLSRVTERFYRVDSGRSRDSGGTGLGLSIVKHVLNRHDARLHIESTPGKGSLFRCDFPPSRCIREARADSA
jgi:two-component system, OmpR family, phosphate regulon sensor histidine kinase PhoR